MKTERIKDYENTIDFQELEQRSDWRRVDFVEPSITLVDFYYQSGEVERAYRRLCALVERIKGQKSNVNFATTNFEAIVRAVDMCFKFDEYAGAAALLEIVGASYKAE